MTKPSPFLAAALNCAILGSLLAQTPPPRANSPNLPTSPSSPTEDEVVRITTELTTAGQQKTPPQTDQDEVIRIKTDLVQLRAVVTDKKGQPVDNLKQDDFEIRENGRSQPVSFFTAARVEIPAAASDASDRKPNMPREQPVRPAANAKPQRSIVLFVDTLHLSATSLIRAKQQLKQFVDEQMTDQDMGAIVTTSSSLGVLQQFMRDRKMLKYAIEKISGFSRPSSFFTPFLAA